MSKTLMIFGLGDLGGWALEFFARREGLGTIVAADMREEWGTMKTHCAAIGAGVEGYSKTIGFETCDVNAIDRTAELIKRYEPDVIYSTLTLSGWLANRVLPAVFGDRFHRCTVAGLPAQTVLLSKLVEAVKRSGVNAPIINHSYPDVVNPVLYRVGLPVLIGAGNLDNIVGEIRRKVSVSRNVPFGDVTVFLIAEHALNVLGSRVGTPYFLKVLVGDKDITEEADVDSLLSDRLLSSPPDSGSWLNHPAIAASAVRNVMAIVNDTNELACAPGPNGLPGGYPVRINARGVEVALPEGVSLEEAVKINTDGMRHEGVDELKDDGTVVLTDEGQGLIKELYGTDLKEIRFSEIEDVAKEMAARQQKLVQQYTIDSFSKPW
jgi:hypothetical protein